MSYGYIEDLKFAVEVFDEGGNFKEVLARLHDLDAARAAYTACRAKYPAKFIYLCQGRPDLAAERSGLIAYTNSAWLMCITA